MKKEKQKGFVSMGFSLLEVVIVIAIISTITAVSLLSWQSFSDAANLGNAAKMIEAKIKLAKSYSLSALNDTNYGVRFEADKVALFNAGTSADIEFYKLSDGVEIYDIAIFGGGSDALCNNGIMDAGETGIDCGGGCLPCFSLVFNRLTGISNGGTFGIRIINRPSKTKTISINAQGQTGTDSFEASSVSPIVNARHIHFNLGWNIENATVLHLAWIDNVTSAPIVTNNIDTASYFNVGKTEFDWSGATLVSGVSQPIRIHSWLDGSGYTVLCVTRDATENEELNIYFTDGIDKDIATYEKIDATGAVNVSAGVYGGTMDIQ